MSDVIEEPFLYKLGVNVPKVVIRVVIHPSVKILPKEVFAVCFSLKEVVLPEGLEEIGDGAFADCISLERINNFPSTLIKIGNHAFDGCRSLKEVTLLPLLPDEAEAETEAEGRLEEIGQYAFANCKSLKRIHNNFPSALVNIGQGAFMGCRSLVEVMLLPEGLRNIGDCAFADCRLLERIDCRSTTIRIGKGAFADCVSLTDVTLVGLGGNIIMTMEANAFGNCRLLEGMTIPSKAFVVEVDGYRHFTCRLVRRNFDGNFAHTDARKVVISPERLNYISSTIHLLEIENAIGAIANGNENELHAGEDKIERVHAWIAFRALAEVSTILELALWKSKMDDEIDEWNNPRTGRGECRVGCG
eukprot:CAMPEP_0201603884 /NCGR_PEP_ID=MMETSP0492-20130828/4197_1 /ASSEMBLY_ACC=CAM_ASM_000837 /TAXON_ID=420259 /ORGANISM="Thalassiosira gravida, Strain GMp14c1" /LENGTH=359 /DNA_ID=CAMNT_0048067779 /DNA_START=263 /DNA_END=1338 /DNA_ORIENTATION=-